MRPNLIVLIFVLTIIHEVRLHEVNKNCSKIKKRYSTKRYVMKDDRELNLTIYWGSDPARVAASLLSVLIKHSLGYQNIYLKKGNHNLEALRKKGGFKTNRKYNELIFAPSTAWYVTSAISWTPYQGQSIGIAGPRLQEYGASMIPARQRLYVHIAKQFQDKERCWRIASSAQWNFYTDTVYTDCGFPNSTLSDERLVYELDSQNKVITKELTKRANAFSLRLKFETIDRTNHFHKLRIGNQSFFFVDYDIWKGDRDVREVLLPPCIPESEAACQQELDNAIAMRVGDIEEIKEAAPQLFELAYNFTISLEPIRTLLEQENDTIQMEDAVCNWVLDNEHIVEHWFTKTDYNILLFYCDDYYIENYEKLLALFNFKSVELFELNIVLAKNSINCTDNYAVRNRIIDYNSHSGSQQIIGAVVGDVNIKSAKDLDALTVPVLLYDAVAVNEDSWTSVWFTNGRSMHLALALRHFIANNTWNRIAVISENSPLAKAFIDSLEKVQRDLKGEKSFVFRNYPYEDAKTVLQQIKDENACIILVNTNYEDAYTILTEAVRLEMNVPEHYAWIVRDWRPNNRTLYLKHFTISFWSRSSKDVSSTEQEGSKDIRNILDTLWPNSSWPPHVVSLTDAILTLVYIFKDILKNYPQGQRNTHGKNYIQQFGKSLNDISPMKGVTQNLKFKGNLLEETLVFLDEWHGGEHELLTIWRVNATAETVEDHHIYRLTYYNRTAPNDGTLPCSLPSEPSYEQTCYDTAAVGGLTLLLLMPFLILLAYKFVRRYLKEREKKIIFQVMVGRRERAAMLSGYLIDRSLLEVRSELGAGRFGDVHLALLRIPRSPPKYVAAKSLRDHQDEREILREACTLASLDHAHIIRLVGVCIDNESPLVLMEVAFFGDLLQYLRSRRYLIHNAASDSTADINQNSEEAIHVSAEALTKLARQAASALGYLSLRGVIHRDVRASNCLVDASRSLKLADFGMAREISGSLTDGDAEYACKRRGLFPVLWMAPESLQRGVFSTASDMWALGVLVFELVTLGARPYGNMSPLRVMHFVTAGGNPPMPRDATPQTRGLAGLCWQREPEQRPTAADVVAYLADRPSALRPALVSDDLPVHVDSGYGESPESEILLPH